MMTLNKSTWNTKTMAKISVLGVISFILMYFKFPLVWLAPPFLKMDISDLPSLLGAFALGPVAGVLIQLLKNVLNIIFEGTTTAGVGEFVNFFSGSVFAVIAGAVYFRKKNFKNAIVGMVAGIIAMTAIMALANYYFIFPLYAKVFGWPIEKLVSMGTAVTDKVVDLKTMIIYTVIPFNLLKGFLTALVTTLLYKKLSPILHK